MFTGYRGGLEAPVNEGEIRRNREIMENVERATRTLIDTIFSQDQDIDRENLMHQIQEIVLQKALFLDAQAQFDQSRQSGNANNEMQNLFGERYTEILTKRDQLQKKWHEMDDSDEKRDVCGLIFVDVKCLSDAYRAILSDDMQLFGRSWELCKSNSDQSWRRFLDLSCLIGSRNIAEFIMQEKKDVLTQKDYGYILSYISLSSDHKWTIDFAEEMKRKNMEMPDCIYQFCDDLDLVDEIVSVFKPDHTIKIGKR